MILLPSIEHTDEPLRVAKQLVDSLEHPFMIDRYQLHITLSIGISVYPVDGSHAEDLLKHADIALYRAKGQGRNHYRMYSPSKDEQMSQRFFLEKDLRRALNEEQLELYYQPRINAKTGKLVGAEALLRWKHPQLGMIPPAEFIPLAEETELILAISPWVKRKVCAQLVDWREKGYPLIPISINMTSQRLLQPNFSREMSEVLMEFGVDGDLIELEITENSVMTNEDFVVETLEALRNMGINILIDDFGTGYSSFFYLKSLPVDGIKIDRSFISDISRDNKNAAITSAMIQLARHLNLDVIAEGVETEEELRFLLARQCYQIQGYLYSKPLSANDFEQYMRQPPSPAMGM